MKVNKLFKSKNNKVINQHLCKVHICKYSNVGCIDVFISGDQDVVDKKLQNYYELKKPLQCFLDDDVVESKFGMYLTAMTELELVYAEDSEAEIISVNIPIVGFIPFKQDYDREYRQ